MNVGNLLLPRMFGSIDALLVTYATTPLLHTFVLNMRDWRGQIRLFNMRD